MFTKSIGLGVATAATVVAAAMTAAPAQAIELYPGSFQINTQADLIGSRTGTGVGSTVTLKLSETTFNLSGVSGVFASQTTLPLSGNFLSDLTLTDQGSNGFGSNIFTSGAVNSFISDLFVDGEAISLNLAAATFVGNFLDGNNFALAGVGLSGTLVSEFSGKTLANATFSALEFGSAKGFSTVAVATVPTPAAVLPALLGMGAAAFRKKKEGEDELVMEGAEEV